MRLSEFLGENAISTNLEATDKVGAIEELVDLLVAEHEISMVDRAAVIESVLSREKSMSTGLGNGVAIPHGAVEGIDDIVAALGLHRRGLDFLSLDGRPAHLLVLVLLPAQRYSYGVHALAGISRLMRHETFRSRLLAARTQADVMSVILAEEEHELLGAVD